MTERTGSIPSGRVRRTAKVGRLVAGEVAKTYRTKAANLVRPEESRSVANERRRMEAAGRVVEVLGQMKGPAMKIGQMASILDLGGMPPDEAERLQAKLGELRDHAPQASFKEMRKVIEQDLGESIERPVCRVRPQCRRRGVHRTGVSSASSRRPRSRGESAIPAHWRCGARGPPEPGPDHAGRTAIRARASTPRLRPPSFASASARNSTTNTRLRPSGRSHAGGADTRSS